MAKRILVVDDDSTALRLIGYSLQQEGYDVVTASNGSDGLSQARKQGPDLIVLDVMMPDLDGFEVCRRLRADPATSRLPIIMLTAKGQVSDRVAGFRAGADDYVVKPADPSELVARVAALLTRAAYAETHEARIVAFMGAKGGVGTTTAAVNIGVHLAKAGHRVALVDLRCGYGTACLHLNVRPRVSLGGLFRGREERSGREVAGALHQHVSGLRVLASPQQPEEYLELTPTIVSGVVDALKADSDFLLLDIPHAHSPWRREALERSAFIVLATEQEPTSLAAAKVALAMVRGYGISTSIVGGLIVHRARASTEMSAMQISNFLEIGLLGVLPTAPEECMAAARMGAPVILAQPQVAISMSLGQVAGRLAEEPVSLQQF
jgi:CheY-like chemotaxis protein/MinD-like ATPase involved in chromosome partitioning or flagellar assembly